MKTALQLRDYGVSANTRPVLADIHLDLPMRGITLVLGPPGAGKSVLLRSVCGELDQAATYSLTGTARYVGWPRDAEHKPHLVRQRLELLQSTIERYIGSAHPCRSDLTPMECAFKVSQTLARYPELDLEGLWEERERSVLELTPFERKRLTIARALVGGAALLCLDEPFRECSEDEAAALERLVLRIAEERAVLVVTHHQGRARALGGDAVLLAAGRLWAKQKTAHFFDSPINELVSGFVASGGCPVPSLAAQVEDVAEEYTRYLHPRVAQIPNPTGLPTGFRWIREGELAGFGRVGFLGEADDELSAVASTGLQQVVCLEETLPVTPEQYQRAGLSLTHFPIVDMAAPDPESALAIARRVEAESASGLATGYCCRAGLGRTGTMLAVHLMLRGASDREAVQHLRTLNTLFVQSDEQLSFLNETRTLINKQESEHVS